MKRRAMDRIALLCLGLAIFLPATGFTGGLNRDALFGRSSGSKGKPDLVVTRIYYKQYMGWPAIWADIKNLGGPIPVDQFNKAHMRFYVTYLQAVEGLFAPKTTGDNGYKLNYLDRKGVLTQTGGIISARAPGMLKCWGRVRVTVKVDLPLSGGGRIEEGNEHNNERTAILQCPK